MAKNYMVVFAKAANGRVAELADWYDNQHIPDLLKVPGFVSAERSELKLFKTPEGAGPWDFMVTYEIEGENPMAVIAESGRRMGTGEIVTSDALESVSTLAGIAASHGLRKA
ncbi:MAG: hypothetical protein JWO33_2596 [Caulobacteraceae bacterium]|nr:hypothetical protein [Caulobacteraceae bacterium]